MARATSSAYRRLPIRWRLAGGSAALTLVILLGFALVVGALTTQRIRSDFDGELRLAADDLQRRMQFGFDRRTGQATCVAPDLETYASAGKAAIRLVTTTGTVLCRTPRAPHLGPPIAGTLKHGGYQVEARSGPILLGQATVIQYARRLSDVDHTVGRVQLFLTLGVAAGTALALLAGLAMARRAMRPIAELTSTAREIERTRDPSLRVPHPDAQDEVAELARTLEGMLGALDASRTETEGTLRRQREFVADASHELRTPLTSVLANLELLAEQLHGDQGEAVASALRSSQRMRRLVADLLLLARADAGRTAPHSLCDLGDVLVETASELEPLATREGHEIAIDVEPAVVGGVRDELHRLALNLMANAIRHTPGGTHIRASVRSDGGTVTLCVQDDGPGIPDELAPRIFERFVRGGGETASSSGLGLAIVRAVAETHGGTVALERPEGGGARFRVRLPAAAEAGAELERAPTPA